MTHKDQVTFCSNVKKAFPSSFDGVNALDAGSLDINGSNRQFFTNSKYLGVDLAPGKNVDQIDFIHDLDFPDEHFDTIISTEMFEHDTYWWDSFLNMYRMLKSGGLLIFTCATTGRRAHGTITNHPGDSPTSAIKGLEHYYKNLTELDFRKAINFDNAFVSKEFIINNIHHDLYFWGIKK